MTFDEFKTLMIVSPNETAHQSGTNETYDVEVVSPPNRLTCLRMIYDQAVRYWGTENIVIFDVMVSPRSNQMYGYGIEAYEARASSQLDFGQYTLIGMVEKNDK